MAKVNVVEYAAKCVRAVESKYERKGISSKFRTRCRQFAEDIYYNPLTYIIAFIASKCGERFLLKDHIFKDQDKIVEEVEKERSLNPEQKSYALYGSFLVKLMVEEKIVKPQNDIGNLLIEIQRAGPIVNIYVQEYALWIKRLSEAKFESE